ncbi:band 4.1-like protein 4A [Rhodnius prolixus]|uniref:band 4.1-like protein 4A n=1 Tax=Rhodnius prolixus TaxID=13249 RepID=UPI003D18BC02
MECCVKRRAYLTKIILLDEQELLQDIHEKTTGEELLRTVFRHLNLIETSYFGLRYIDTQNQTHWLDAHKRVCRQLKGKQTFTLYFGVKFYAVDPCKLVEEITRYQFFLQLKQDILQGRLPVPMDLAAELGAYLVQSELGDYDPRRHSPGYVSEFRFISNQTVDLENKICELHKQLVGQQPPLAELNYLEKVKWLEMYGVDLHPVLGEDNTEYFLGLTPNGIIVLRNKNKVASYFWPRITKIYHKGKYFMLRVNVKKNEENTYGFETPSKSACRHLYKCCVEHNAFFRLVQITSNPPDIIGTSGTREKSIRASNLRVRTNPQFVRMPSRKYQRRIPEEIIQESNADTENAKFESIIACEDVKQCMVSSLMKRSSSPRSTQSLPPSRGLYSSSSPRSLRSASQIRVSSSRRSISVDSRSSNDSKSYKNQRRRGSDNESEISKCSSKSRRRRNRSRRSSSDKEVRRHRTATKQRYELVDSREQWRQVQRKQAEGSIIQKAKVVTSRRPNSDYYSTIGHNVDSYMTNQSSKSKRHRKHRSRSRSPADGKRHFPDEVKRHLEFSLIDTDGMTESQLKEIPYKVVETSTARAIKLKNFPQIRSLTTENGLRRSEEIRSAEIIMANRHEDSKEVLTQCDPKSYQDL